MDWWQSWNDADEYERCYWRRVAVAILLGIGAAALIVLLARHFSP